MYQIKKDGQVLERCERVQYIRTQANGVRVLGTARRHDALYSPASDTVYYGATLALEAPVDENAESIADLQTQVDDFNTAVDDILISMLEV